MAKSFEAELVEGHKGVVVAMVPFDPEVAFKRKPVRLAGTRHGWLVRGTVNGVAFEGYVGDRWGRFFVTVDAKLRRAAGVATGDTVSLVLTPTTSRQVFAKAMEQSKKTTAPGEARADAVVMADD
jgi:hypothetical protein